MTQKKNRIKKGCKELLDDAIICLNIMEYNLMYKNDKIDKNKIDDIVCLLNSIHVQDDDQFWLSMIQRLQNENKMLQRICQRNIAQHVANHHKYLQIAPTKFYQPNYYEQCNDLLMNHDRYDVSKQIECKRNQWIKTKDVEPHFLWILDEFHEFHHLKKRQKKQEKEQEWKQISNDNDIHELDIDYNAKLHHLDNLLYGPIIKQFADKVSNSYFNVGSHLNMQHPFHSDQSFKNEMKYNININQYINNDDVESNSNKNGMAIDEQSDVEI